ncbi:uncharacterized protein LOC114255819 [Camellia sinensis]|uniref:uncharacterized protein LOC114255819 n=1 Tax=Camellia sinensis TaxID=4442 RepID=UPI001036B55C|nr:uncharacterized protein LOC114255819 [Camellia sinensis]
MNLDAKGIQVCMRKVLNFFNISCCTFIKKYPVVSGILFLFFLLYMFIPSLFTFLVFSLPILIFIVVAFRLIFNIHQQNLKNARGQKMNCEISSQIPNSAEDDSITAKKENSSCVRPLSVRRRYAKEKDKEVSVQEGVKKKDMVSSTISYDDLVDKTALIEENLKEIREVKVDSMIDHTESSSTASQRLRPECPDDSEETTDKFSGGGGELEAESSDDAEDDDGEETQEDRNKAVEWTEDDQKNLMDLGISEIERNKRLEGLIAKRKARKLLSIQVRKTLMNLGNNNPRSQIANILIPRGNPFPANNFSEPQVSPTPSSAPSVLLPMHNPFDLPYAPQEEKPNLTGDDFEEEFISTQQKDMIFCRHESFSLGAFFPGPGEFDQSRCENFYHNFGTRHRTECSRLRNQTDKEGTNQIIQTKSIQEGKPMYINNSYNHSRQQGQTSEQVLNLVDVHYQEDRSEVHTEPRLVKDALGGSSSLPSSEVNVPISMANKDETLKSLSFSVLKNIAVDKEDNARRNELLYDSSPSSFEKKRPPEECLFYVDGLDHTRSHSMASDLQVEVSEVSSPAQTIDGITSPSDGEFMVYDVDVDTEKKTTSSGEEMWAASPNLSRVEENELKSKYVNEVSEQDIIEVGFSSINKKSEDPAESSVLPEKVVKQDLPENSQTHAMDFNDKVYENVQPPSTSYSSKAILTENLASSTLENTQQSTEESEARSSHCGDSRKLEEQPSSLPETSAREVNIIYNMNDQAALTNDDKEIWGFIKDTYGEAPILIKREAPRDQSVPNKKNDAKFTELIENNSGDPKNDHSKSTKYYEGELQNQSEQKHTAEDSNLIGNMNVQDRKDEQGVADIGSSRPNQNFDDPTISSIQLEMVGEQGPNNSSSSLSPISMTKDTLHLTEGPVTYPPNVRDPGKLLEPCIPPENSIRELSIISDMNDSKVPMNHDIGNLKIVKDIGIQETISNPIVYNEGQHEQHGESEILELYKLDEQIDNSKCFEDFEAELEKEAKHKGIVAPSRPLKKTAIWESKNERECEQGEVDVEFSGVNQSFNNLIPSTMLPELVVEQVPIALSSSSSPKSETQKMVSVDPTPSSNIDLEMHLKVQKRNEEQEPSNLPMKSTQELNYIDSVKDSQVPANDEMKNLKTTDDTKSEVHGLIKEENSGVVSKMSEEGKSKSIDTNYMEVQSGKMDENQTILESHDPTEHNDNLKSSKKFEGESLKLAECNNTTETSKPIGNTDILESTQEHVQETVVGISEVSQSTNGLITSLTLPSTAESGLYGLNQSFTNDPNPPSVVSEVVEQISNASSSSSSPKSVLETKLSIDQASISGFDQEMHVGLQQPEREMEENNMLNGLPPEILIPTVPQNTLHLMEDSTDRPSNGGESKILQDAPNYSGKSIKEDNVHCNINSSVSNEKKEKLNLQSTEDVEAKALLLTDNSVVILVEENEHSGAIKRIEEFGESMKSKDTENPSMPTPKDSLEATEVVEDKFDVFTAYEANDVRSSRPMEQNNDSNISVTSVESKEPFRADPGRSIEEVDSTSSEYESIANVILSKEDLSSGVGETQCESQRLIRPIVVVEQSENAEVINPSSIKNEGNSKKITEAEDVGGSLQLEGKNDNLTDTKDNKELENNNHETVIDILKSSHGNDGLNQVEK